MMAGADDRSPESLSSILGRMFSARGWGRLSEREQLERAWAQVIDEEMKPKTRVASLRRGVLQIHVSNSILMQELAQFHKRRLLAALREQLGAGKINDLQFRPAVWEESSD